MYIVRDVRPENREVATIILAGGLNTEFRERRAGQFLLLQTYNDGNWSRPHPFTISNAPEDDFLQLTIKRVGIFTTAVHRLQPGTEVNCRGPYGNFCTKIEEQDNIVMIAGGIGITPFLSVLRHFRHTKYNGNITLFWANNTTNDFFAVKELSGLLLNLKLQVIFVVLKRDVSQLSSEFYNSSCFIEEGLLTQEILQHYADLNVSSLYLCGSIPMQSFVLEQLKYAGIDEKRVEKETLGHG